MAEKNPQDPADRYDETIGDEGGGITNRPLDEEIEKQESLPKPGESRDGANAGHGKSDSPTQSER